MLYKYRVTKYNPQNRDKTGKYLIDEWTSFSDIGKTFGGSVLTEAEYIQVEDTYVASASAFMHESGINTLAITDLENSQTYQETGLDIQPKKIYRLEEAQRLFRLVLREKIWCKFSWKNEAYIHFGWDYYMYIGVSNSCPKAIAYAEERGLFVEVFESPHLEIT